MQTINETITQRLSQLTPDDLKTLPAAQDYEQFRADNINADTGTLTGYDCQECKNKGFVAVVADGHMRIRDCKCQKQRKSMYLIEKSGLKPILDRYTFDSFQTPEKWQKNAKALAQKYVADKGWFTMLGQSGSGKTHLCTAICGELLKQCRSVHYMLWRDYSVKLKAAVNDSEYDQLMEPLKSCDVLYIDDFLKSDKPTVGDTNLAFEILNYRYMRQARTIISSEWSRAELLGISEAIGGRVCEMSGEYLLMLDGKQNWRLR